MRRNRKGWIGLGLLGALLSAPAWAQSSGSASLLPPAQVQFSDANGAPLAGGTVKTCVAGSSCGQLKATWSDPGMVSANPNPIVLDAAGRATIYGSGTYYEEVRDAQGNLVTSGLTSAVNGTLLASAPPVSLVGNPSGTTGPAQAVGVTAPLGFANGALGFQFPVVVDSNNQNVDSTFNQTLRVANGALTYNLPQTGNVNDGFDFRIYVNFGPGVTVQPDPTSNFAGSSAGTPITVPLGSVARITGSHNNFWVATLSPSPTSGKYAPGQVMLMRTTSCPSGTVPENGAALSRTGYPGLFAALGTAWGAGDGSTTFNVPNAGGMFNRGYEVGQSVDSGRTFGATQQDQLQAFTVTTPVPQTTTTEGGGSGGPKLSPATTPTAGTVAGAGSSTLRSGSETRPVNIPALSCIGTGLPG